MSREAEGWAMEKKNRKFDTVRRGIGRGHTRVKMPAIPLTMPGRYSVGNVLAVTAWSHATLYARIKQGRFPQGEKDGSRRYWTTEAVRKALGV
jgi:hypothetical protein